MVCECFCIQSHHVCGIVCRRHKRYNRVSRNRGKVLKNKVGRVLRIQNNITQWFELIQYLSTRPTFMVSALEKRDLRRSLGGSRGEKGRTKIQRRETTKMRQTKITNKGFVSWYNMEKWSRIWFTLSRGLRKICGPISHEKKRGKIYIHPPPSFLYFRKKAFN